MTAVGARLRAIRRARDLTLKEVAEGAGLSKSFISQIESGVVNPSIASLNRITEFLEISPSELLEQQDLDRTNGHSGEQEAAFVAIVRKDQRKGLVWADSPRPTYLLTPDLQHRIEVLLTDLEPGMDHQESWTQHVGEEFGFVLAGSVEYLIGENVYPLDEGDSIYFGTTTPHKVRASGNKPARVIMVLTPPWF